MDALSLSTTLGAVVGIILALTGAGGAILAVPLLVAFLHLDVAQAAPIALLAVGVSAATGALAGLRAKTVRYRAAAFMAAAGMAASPAGLWLAHRLPNAPLTVLFALVLAYVAQRMFRQTLSLHNTPVATTPSAPPCRLDARSGRFIWNRPCTRALALTGLGAGFLSGLLGVGGGFVVVPALKKATDAPLQAIVATSLAVIALVSASGVAAASTAGRVNWQLGVPFAGGALLGMLAGRALAGKVGGTGVQRAFALVSGAIAIGMIVRVVMAQ
ncbi:sulfite exporter TauE/SafE family protein [Pseudoduganella sp. OTU4001]|uniref:sulfite exporter TauE/SafE family protein n=1 Tax=Pseudoduganella sp. OTU4001 TaxID=3043854 RepID=UPI00313A76EB